VAFVQRTARQSVVWLSRNVEADATSVRRLFAGAGAVKGLAWSPDARWLLLDWVSANQWLFVRGPVRRLRAVSNIRAAFGPDAALGSWCCP